MRSHVLNINWSVQLPETFLPVGQDAKGSRSSWWALNSRRSNLGARLTTTKPWRLILSAMSRDDNLPPFGCYHCRSVRRAAVERKYSIRSGVVIAVAHLLRLSFLPWNGSEVGSPVAVSVGHPFAGPIALFDATFAPHWCLSDWIADQFTTEGGETEYSTSPTPPMLSIGCSDRKFND